MGTVDKLTELQYRRSVIEQGGGEAEIKKQHDAKKLTARERINALTDDGSFVEIDAFVTHRAVEYGMDCTEAPGEGVVAGYGTVDGRPVYVYAQDFTALGGSVGEMHSKKICKVMDMAAKTGTPVIGISDSSGARIQEGTDALAGLGEILYRNTLNSGVVPQISVVMGTCAGAAAASAALSDFVFMVENTGKMFMTGPQVIENATGEKVDAAAFGGADVHSEKSGEVDFKAANDEECIAKVRELLSFLPSNNLEETPYVPADDINRVSERLTAIVPDDTTAAYDVRGVIAEIADNGAFMEVQKDFAQNMVIGFARMNGLTVGIAANQPAVNDGLIDANAAEKAARFVRFCDSFNIPVVTFTDSEGFAASKAQEESGLISSSAKLIYAFAEATVPKVNVIIRKAYGSAYIAMNSKNIGADMVLAWPTAEIAVMNPDGAANILFKDSLKNSSEPMSDREEKVQEYKNKAASPFEAAKRGYVDDVIEPDSTRPRIIAALQMLEAKREARPAKKHGNIPV